MSNNKILSLGLINKYIPMNIKYKLETKIPNSGDYELNNINVELLAESSSISQMSSYLHKEIIKGMILLNEDFIDVAGMSDWDGINMLFNYISKYEFDFLICASEIASNMMDSFLFENFSDKDNKLNLYKFGSFMNVDCYVDPYMKYSDTRIICGKKCGYEYNYNYDIINNGLVSYLTLEYNLVFNESKFITLNYMTDDSDNPIYKQVRRDRKIDKII